MAIYPYKFVLTKNVRQALVPVRGAKVLVFRSGSDVQKPLYPTAIEDTGSLIPADTLVTDVNGEVQFFTTPGRIRVDAIIDDVTTRSIEDVIADQDMLILEVFNETPGGSLTGTNFTLVQSVLGNKISLYVNGTLWNFVSSNVTPSGAQYTVVNNLITTGQAPGAGANLVANYIPVPA